jgi:hypothetical protein
MCKLIIYITGKPLLNGYRRREFVWSEPHACYLYENTEFLPAEFNAKYEKAVRNNADLNPRVRVIEGDEVKAPVIPMAPVSTLSTAREISADEAEEVLMRLRPDRLKKKTGPKPEGAMEVA